MNLKKSFLLLLVVGGGIIGYHWYVSYPPEITLTLQENKTMKTFMQGVSTRCVGRYLIDIPGSFSVEEGNALAFVNDAPIKTKRIYRPAFEQKIRLREEKLRSEKTVNPRDMPYLKQIYSLPEGMEGVIFERNRSISLPDSSRVLEAHFYINGVAVEVELRARNGLSSRYEDERKNIPEIYGNTVPEKVAELTWLLKRISGRKDTEIPHQAGLCLPDIFIADGRGKEKESIDLGYTSPEYPELMFDFLTDNFNSSDTLMLERSVEMERDIKKLEGRTIQKGKRELNDIYTEEWLVAGKTDSDEKILRFVLHANEKKSGSETPWMYMSFLQRGFSGSNQLSENEAVSVWEQITGTLRIRPGAFGR